MSLRGYVPRAPWTEEVTIEVECPGIPLVVFLGDLHYGHEGTNHERILSDIETLEHCPDDVSPIVIMMGDLIDNAIRSAPGTASAETVVRVKEQKDEVLALLRRLDDKIVGVIQGNHEERSYREDDFDVGEWFAHELGVAYLGAGCKVNLVINRNGVKEMTTILAGHTYGGANPTGRCRNFYNRRGPADVVALAHMHVPFIGTEYIQDKQRVFVQTGTYQEFSRFFMENTLSSSKTNQPAVAILGDAKVPFLDFKVAITALTGKIIEKVDNSEQIKKVESEIDYIKKKLDELKPK